jgi:hypothetical protein
LQSGRVSGTWPERASTPVLPAIQTPRRINMFSTLQRTIAAAMFVMTCFALPASAQETLRIRGTVESVDGSVYVVKNRDGADVKLTITDPQLYVAIVKATMADIKPGQFVGATGVTQPDGSQKAIEVHIFPESMRGTGEGHYDWDLRPNTKMTNANVEQTVGGVDGPVLTVKYKDGEKKVFVTPETQVVTYVIGDKADLKPGIKIFVGAAKKGADGTWQTPRVTYGKDGLTPPM